MATPIFQPLEYYTRLRAARRYTIIATPSPRRLRLTSLPVELQRRIIILLIEYHPSCTLCFFHVLPCNEPGHYKGGLENVKNLALTCRAMSTITLDVVLHRLRVQPAEFLRSTHESMLRLPYPVRKQYQDVAGSLRMMLQPPSPLKSGTATFVTSFRLEIKEDQSKDIILLRLMSSDFIALLRRLPRLHTLIFSIPKHWALNIHWQVNFGSLGMFGTPFLPSVKTLAVGSHCEYIADLCPSVTSLISLAEDFKLYAPIAEDPFIKFLMAAIGLQDLKYIEVSEGWSVEHFPVLLDCLRGNSTIETVALADCTSLSADFSAVEVAKRLSSFVDWIDAFGIMPSSVGLVALESHRCGKGWKGVGIPCALCGRGRRLKTSYVLHEGQQSWEVAEEEEEG